MQFALVQHWNYLVFFSGWWSFFVRSTQAPWLELTQWHIQHSLPRVLQRAGSISQLTNNCKWRFDKEAGKKDRTHGDEEPPDLHQGPDFRQDEHSGWVSPKSLWGRVRSLKMEKQPCLLCMTKISATSPLFLCLLSLHPSLSPVCPASPSLLMWTEWKGNGLVQDTHPEGAGPARITGARASTGFTQSQKSPKRLSQTWLTLHYWHEDAIPWRTVLEHYWIYTSSSAATSDLLAGCKQQKVIALWTWKTHQIVGCKRIGVSNSTGGNGCKFKITCSLLSDENSCSS